MILFMVLHSLNICIEGQGDFFLHVIMFIKYFKINKNFEWQKGVPRFPCV